MSLLLNVGLVCNVYRRVGVTENAKAKMQSACLHRNILLCPDHVFMKKNILIGVAPGSFDLGLGHSQKLSTLLFVLFQNG